MKADTTITMATTAHGLQEGDYITGLDGPYVITSMSGASFTVRKLYWWERFLLFVARCLVNLRRYARKNFRKIFKERTWS